MAAVKSKVKKRQQMDINKNIARFVLLISMNCTVFEIIKKGAHSAPFYLVYLVLDLV